jgi:3-oxoacyl-[acyl-carrier protein] reductase
VALLRAVVPGMRERGWGRVLAVGSSGVEAPLPNLAASNVGRAALAAYLKTLATEVAADGVTVNLLLPGRIATDRVAALDEAAARRQDRPVAEVRAASRAAIPTGRYGEPAEFGAVAAFLCSERASYVTGSLVRCDGGMLAHL